MIDQYPPANGVLTSLIWRKTAAGGETSLSGYDNASQALSYTPGQEQVYLNGILLVRGDDYTATNGTSITGLSALAANDFIQVNCYNNFSVATTPATSITGTIANNQLANSAITINGTATSLGGTYTNSSASTSTAGIVQLTDSTSSTSTTTAATPNSVKSAYDLANGAIQKTLTTTTGDIIYASSANTPARLGIGSTGQILTVSGGVPSWAAPSGGALTWTLLNSGGTTLSGSAKTTISFSAKKQLLILFEGASSVNASSFFQIRLNDDSATNYTSAGTFGRIYSPLDADLTNQPWWVDTFTEIRGGRMSTDANSQMWGSVIVTNADSTSYKIFTAMGGGNRNGGNNAEVINQQGFYKGTSAITSVSFNSSTGNFDAGAVYVYGGV
jgi:hypothetical protein